MVSVFNLCRQPSAGSTRSRWDIWCHVERSSPLKVRKDFAYRRAMLENVQYPGCGVGGTLGVVQHLCASPVCFAHRDKMSFEDICVGKRKEQALLQFLTTSGGRRSRLAHWICNFHGG